MKRFFCNLFCILITLGFLFTAYYIFPSSLSRLLESGRDIFNSIIYFFSSIFGKDFGTTPTVLDLPKTPFFEFLNGGHKPSDIIPDTAEGFKQSSKSYWLELKNPDNIIKYLNLIFGGLGKLIYILTLLIPLLLLFKHLFNKSITTVNNDYGRDTLPLKLYKRTLSFFTPLKLCILTFARFLKSDSAKPYRALWLITWLINFNIITIILEFIAFYFYFCITFDFSSLYIQLYKLGLDISVPLTFILVYLWVIISLFILDKLRKSWALSYLRRLELRNRGFINSRPLVLFIVGTVGKGKTTLMTDIALSKSIIMRDEAYKLLLECDLKFPAFPWLLFAKKIEKAINEGKIHSLATCNRYLDIFRTQWQASGSTSILGYNTAKHGTTYNNGIKDEDLWQVMSDFAKLYIIFMHNTSILISNYPIREDTIRHDLKNFPRWHTDFFGRDRRLIKKHTRFSHILDFDMLRLGKKMIKNNKFKDVFEYGVIVITEIGKERLNALELKEVKKKDKNANQLNDKTNDFIKLIRHRSTVCNYPFATLLCDDQRPNSWGADARELTDILYIKEKSDKLLALKFFSLGELLHSFIFSNFKNLYSDYRFFRGDNTLTMHLIKRIGAFMHNYHTRIYNKYSFYKLTLAVEDGLMQEGRVEYNYYLIPAKIYSNRFNTAGYADIFQDKALGSQFGLQHLPSFKSVTATKAELKSEGSYFIKNITNIFEKEDEWEDE